MKIFHLKVKIYSFQIMKKIKKNKLSKTKNLEIEKKVIMNLERVQRRRQKIFLV